MQRHAAGIDGGNTSRCGNDHPLGVFFFDLVQKRSLACSRLTGKNDILACFANVFECEVELGIQAKLMCWSMSRLAIFVPFESHRHGRSHTASQF